MARASTVRRTSVPPPELQPINPDVFYNEAETAHFLRLKNPKTLTVWRSRGEHPELRSEKPYGRVLYRGAAILDFLSGTAAAPETSKPPAAPKRKKGSKS